MLEEIGIPATLEQTAEECSELAQAALKLARKMRGENPTPIMTGDILNSLQEEIADVIVCLDALMDCEFLSEDDIKSIMTYKRERGKSYGTSRETKDGA